jgi:hypothetical protein
MWQYEIPTTWACTVLSTALRTAVRFVSLLHESRFGQLPLQCFLTRRSDSSATEPFARNGLSLARNGHRLSRRPFQGQSSWPATSLSCQLVSLPVRSFGSTTLGTVCPAPGCFPASNPLPALPASFSGRLSPSPLPFGVLSPKAQSVQRMALPSGSPSESARFPFAPRRQILLLDASFGSPFPVRYVSGSYHPSVGLLTNSFELMIHLLP